MAVHDHQLWVYLPGATNTSSSNVDFVLQGTLGSVPMPASPVVRPLECRVESQPWSVDVVDSSGSFTAQLASTAGYYDILQRVVRSRRSIDGGAYQVIGSGRLTDVRETHPGMYRVSIQDETAIVRSNVLFNTTNTTHLYPSGPHTQYGPFKAAPVSIALPTAQPGGRQTVDGRWHYLVTMRTVGGTVPQGARNAIAADMVPEPSEGGFNFQNLRCTLNGSSFRVANFGYILDGPWRYTNNWLFGLDVHMSQNQPLRFWVIGGSSTSLSIGTQYPNSYLHMMGAPPSPGTPLHIGGATGIHPMELKRQIFNGAYQSTDTQRVRYSTAAFDNGTTGLLRRPMPPCRFRITREAVMSEWLDDYLNQPCGVVDLLDSSGRLRPRSLWLPNSSGISTTGFREFTAANLRAPHPTFGHSVSDMVTVLNYEYTAEREGVIDKAGDPEPNTEGDGLVVETKSTEHSHTRVAALGRRPMTIKAHGWHLGGIVSYRIGPEGVTPTRRGNELPNLIAAHKPEFFDRFGDGPVMGEMSALSTGDTVEPGDYVRLTLGSYPNAQIQARGGTRLVQALNKVTTPQGPMFGYLDAGPNLQPLTKPTLTLANSTGSPKHTILATIGSVTAGGTFELQAAVSTTQPSSQSGLWISVRTSAVTTGIYSIGQRPAGGTVWARARNMAAGRLRSGWRVSSAGRATSALAAPTALATTSVRDGTADLVWVPGETAYATDVFLDTSTGATPGDANRALRQPPATRVARLGGMLPNTLHRVWVRHFDNYGGVSGTDSTTFTTLTTGSTANLRMAPPPNGLWVHEGMRI